MAGSNPESAHEDGSTIAGRRQPLKEPPTLDQAEVASYHWNPTDEPEPRTGSLRVVNETRERLDSDTSVLADLRSASSIPYQWSASGFAADQNYRARWRDSVDSKHGEKSTVQMSFHDLATDIRIKIRLLPTMKALKNISDKAGLAEALQRAKAVLDFAVDQNASAAIQGRCSYYVGVAQFLLNDQDASQSFTGALDAKGVYEEGRWAQQWVNHYDNLSELSPKRVALSERPISWTNDMYGRRSDVVRELPEPGVPVTTPVRRRFSLDVRDEPEEDSSFNSDGVSNRMGSSIAGGEPIPSFSSWGSQVSSRTAATASTTHREAVIDIDDLLSPKSTTTQQTDKGSNSVRSRQLSSGHLRSKSVSFSPTTLVPDAEKQETLRHRRRQSSIFSINTASSILKKVRELSISPTKSTEQLMEEGASPGFAPTESQNA